MKRSPLILAIVALGCAPVSPPLSDEARVLDAGRVDDVGTIAQGALARLRARGANHAAVVIVDPVVGRILGQAGDILRPTRVGSTLKPFSVAAALDAGLDPGRRFSGEGGAWMVGDQRFRDAHPRDSLDAAEVLIHSSNIGAAKLVRAVGADAVRRSFDALGLSTDARWDSDKALTLAGGVGMLVSPRDLAAAYVSLANDGEVVALDDSGSSTRQRVFSAATARTLREMLTRAAGGRGTGSSARVEGLHVAGKTGTCMDGDRRVATFAGLVGEPVTHVVVVTATVNDGWGGSVAAPEFARIASELSSLR